MVESCARIDTGGFVFKNKYHCLFSSLAGCVFGKTFFAGVLFLAFLFFFPLIFFLLLFFIICLALVFGGFFWLLFYFSSNTHPPVFLHCAGFCTNPAWLNIAGYVIFMTPNSLQIRMIFCHTGLTFSWKNLLPKRRKNRHVKEIWSTLFLEG